MKRYLWVDDVREPPNDDYVWVKSVNEAIQFIFEHSMYHWVPGQTSEIELIDLDHDAGDYAWDGGDYIKILDWLEETGRNIPICIHSMNPVGVQNMRAIIQRNGWTEVK